MTASGTPARTRSDGIAAIVLRRAELRDPAVPAWCPRPPYARVLACATNNDGHTKEGITFPSGPAQKALAQEVPFLCSPYAMCSLLSCQSSRWWRVFSSCCCKIGKGSCAQ